MTSPCSCSCLGGPHRVCEATSLSSVRPLLTPPSSRMMTRILHYATGALRPQWLLVLPSTGSSFPHAPPSVCIHHLLSLLILSCLGRTCLCSLCAALAQWVPGPWRVPQSPMVMHIINHRHHLADSRVLPHLFTYKTKQ